jgi:hypothetical protein
LAGTSSADPEVFSDFLLVFLIVTFLLLQHPSSARPLSQPTCQPSAS